MKHLEINTKQQLLFDYDDVLFPLIPMWLNEINNIHGTKTAPEDIVDWDIAKYFPTLTKDQVCDPIYQDSFWERIVPYDGAVYSLFDLYKKGHIIKIVTATSYFNVKAKMETLFKYFPFLSWEQNVHITSNKQDVRGYVLVDDKADNLIGGDYKKILINKPHNREVKVAKEILRVQNIVEACEIINYWLSNESNK